MGSSHFSEIGYVFYNLINLGYAPGIAPFGDDAQAKKKKQHLARLMTRMWISFISDLDPNHHKRMSPFLL